MAAVCGSVKCAAEMTIAHSRQLMGADNKNLQLLISALESGNCNLSGPARVLDTRSDRLWPQPRLLAKGRNGVLPVRPHPNRRRTDTLDYLQSMLGQLKTMAENER